MLVELTIKEFNGTIAELMEILGKHVAINDTFSFTTLHLKFSEVSSKVSNDNEILAKKIRAMFPKEALPTKIQAVKIHRELTESGICEAKEWVEANMSEFPPYQVLY